MTWRVGMIARACLASLALAPAPANAQTTGSYLKVVFSDVLVSSIRSGRNVAATRTDAQGRFRFDLPPGDYSFCVNGPGLRSVIDRSGSSQDEVQTVQFQIGLSDNLEMSFPASVAGPGRRGPAAEARDLCFPYSVNAAPIPADYDGDGRLSRDLNGQDPANGGRAGGVQVAAGDLNGDGRANRRIDPRIPPPGAGSGTARPVAPQPVAVTGSVRLVR